MARHGATAPVLALMLFGASGLGAIIWGTSLETFSLGRAFVFFVPVLIYAFFLLSHSDPLRLGVTTLLILLPVLGVAVPPVRLQLTVFDVAALLISVLLLARALGGKRVDPAPVPYAAWPLLLFLPAVLMALDPARALFEWLHCLLLYAVFVALAHYLQDAHWRQHFYRYLALGLLLSSAFVIVQKLTGMNLSLYQERSMNVVDGMLIKRGSGLFQDPQKAAQFIAVWAGVLAVLLARGACTDRWARIFALIALILAVPALLFTVSRLALAAGLAAILIGLTLLNRSGIASRIVTSSIAVLLLCTAGLIFISAPRLLLNILPVEVVKRFEATDESASVRMKIWSDSWRIFTESPLAGIGPGNYQEYWLRQNPKLRRAQEAGLFVQDQPESGYLKILYEGGALGALGTLIFLGGFVLSGLRKLRETEPDRTAAWAALLGMSVFLATFATLFTTSDARNAVTLVLLSALLAPQREAVPDVVQS